MKLRTVFFTTMLLATAMMAGQVIADDTAGQNMTTQTMQDQSLADKNKMQGEAFLNANKLKPGVVTLADGLQYKVIDQGTGPKPTDTDLVTVDYAGTLIDGTEFDSSYKRGEPATFPVSGVIPGGGR